MKTDYAYPTSQKRGDIAVTSNTVDRYPRSDFIINAKICAMVTAEVIGMLTRLRLNRYSQARRGGQVPEARDQICCGGPSLSSLCLDCFGGIGFQTARFLCILAFLEFRQHDAIRELAGLAPLSPPHLDRLLRGSPRLWSRLL